MEFRILGALDVQADGEPIRLPGRNLPTILAALLLEAGRVVTVSHLIDAVWDADPPGTARRQIQNAVAALRRALAAAGADPITSAAQGYRIDPDWLDLAEFHGHLDDARRYATDGRTEAAARSAAAGLALWRGPLLSGISSPIIGNTAMRLDEARLELLEERIAAELELGHHHELTGELRELVSRHPYRQRAAGQLMLALYRSGRTAEALETFEDTRRRLADELGIDPHEPLRRLHESILRAEADLPAGEPAPPAPTRPAAPPAPAAAEPSVPFELPAETGGFTGRDTELAALDRLLDSDRTTKLGVVSGTGGAGKTALTIHWGHAHRDDFPDGQLYVNLRGFEAGEPAEPLSALRRILRALGQSGDAIPFDLDEAAGLYRSLMRGRRMLVLLDNARDAGQVRPLLPGSVEAVTVVTSRNRLASLVALNSAKPVRVDGLPTADAITLLTETAGPDADLDPVSARRIADLCGRLPLALRIAAAILIDDPKPADLVARLESADPVSALAVDEDSAANIAASFDLSVEALDPASRDLFRRLGTIPGTDFATGLAEAVAADPGTVASGLKRLVTSCLLEQPARGRYRFHDLIRDHARRTAHREFDETMRDALAGKIIEWFEVPEGAADPAEFDNFMLTFATFVGHPHVWRLAFTASSYARDGYVSDEGCTLVERSLPLAKADRDPDAATIVYAALSGLNAIAGHSDRSLEAAREAVEWVEQQPVSPKRVGVAYNNLALQLYRQGALRDAEVFARKAYQVAEEHETVQKLTSRAGNLGTICLAVGKLGEAERLLNYGLELVSKAGDVVKPAAQLASARLYAEMGKYERAAELLHSILDTSRPSIGREALIVMHLGHVEHRGQHRTGLAESHFLRAFELLAQLPQRYNELLLMEYWSLLCIDTGELGRAGDMLAKAESLPTVGSVEAGELRYSRCRFELATGHPDAAINAGREAADLAESIGHLLWRARSLLAVAHCHDALGDVPAAADARRQVRDLVRQMDCPTVDLYLPMEPSV